MAGVLVTCTAITSSTLRYHRYNTLLWCIYYHSSRKISLDDTLDQADIITGVTSFPKILSASATTVNLYCFSVEPLPTIFVVSFE